MKKLLLMFVFSAVAAVGIAYAASLLVTTRIAKIGGVWTTFTTAPNCPGAAAACVVEFTTPTATSPAKYQAIGNAAPATAPVPPTVDTYQMTNFDHDNDPSTPVITFTVTVLSRFL